LRGTRVTLPLHTRRSSWPLKIDAIIEKHRWIFII